MPGEGEAALSQNIYDQPQFFEGYCQLRRSTEGLDGAPEWPSLQAMLPDVRGLEVLDLGCGFGWFCRWARDQGASSVLGVDLSERMLARARADTSGARITYELGNLEQMALLSSSFDLVYSSLAFHYVADADRLFAQIRQALKPGGWLVFSTEHPIYTAPSRPRWEIDDGGRKTWPVDRYLLEGPRITEWLSKEVVKYHRTIGTTLNLLLLHGFNIAHVEEFRPTNEQIAALPSLEEELERPMFLLVSAQAR